MPAKRIKYNIKVNFVPNQKQNDSEDTVEPEHFKYGIYLNDGYDYMSHLVSLEEFNNAEGNLKELVKQNRENSSMTPCQEMKSAKVIKEFEVANNSDGDNLIEKIQNLAKNDIDEDILNALNSDAELSELEDDFVDIADGTDEKPVIKGDKDIFNQFFGNKIENEVEGESNEFSDFVSNIRKPIDDISEQLNFFDKRGNNYNDQSQFYMPNDPDNSSNGGFVSKSLLNALERMKQQEENAEVVLEPIDKSSVFYQGLYKGETEYDEKEINKAVDEWVYRKPKVTTSALDVTGKVSKFQPKMVSIESIKNKRKAVDEMEIVESTDGDDDGEENRSQVEYTDVSQFHVPRPQNETADEKRDRKKAIKSAKRVRKQEKKISREFYKQ